MHLDSLGYGHVSSAAGAPLFDVAFRVTMTRAPRLVCDVAVKMPIDPYYAVGAGPLILAMPDGVRVHFEVPEGGVPDDDGYLQVVVTGIDVGRPS